MGQSHVPAGRGPARASAERRRLRRRRRQGAALAAGDRTLRAVRDSATGRARASRRPSSAGRGRCTDGSTAYPSSEAAIGDLTGFARDVAHFLTELARVDSAGGPLAGSHSFHRGAHPRFYDDEVQRSLAVLDGAIDTVAARRVWDAALSTEITAPPVWFHGDIAHGNLLVREGRLSAVIDFGTSGVGDPACDLAIAWTMFDDDARSAFRAGLPWDDEVVGARARVGAVEGDARRRRRHRVARSGGRGTQRPRGDRAHPGRRALSAAYDGPHHDRLDARLAALRDARRGRGDHQARCARSHRPGAAAPLSDAPARAARSSRSPAARGRRSRSPSSARLPRSRSTSTARRASPTPRPSARELDGRSDRVDRRGRSARCSVI